MGQSVIAEVWESQSASENDNKGRDPMPALAMYVASNMSTHPTSSRLVSCSPRNTKLNTAAKTPSNKHLRVKFHSSINY